MQQIKLFLDSAKKQEMLLAKKEEKVSGFTTNPTLMKQAGVEDYEGFVKEMTTLIPDMPLSFEVFSDSLEEMEKEARKIFSCGENVYVKIPVTNTQGVSTAPIVKSLSSDGIPLNITALFTLSQVDTILEVLDTGTPAILSIFAGRIANAGIDPMPIMKEASEKLALSPNFELLWASPREALNLIQAKQCGCDIITMTPSLIKATENFGKDLTEYSLETVKMFYNDAKAASYAIK